MFILFLPHFFFAMGHFLYNEYPGLHIKIRPYFSSLWLRSAHTLWFNVAELM